MTIPNRSPYQFKGLKISGSLLRRKLSCRRAANQEKNGDQRENDSRSVG